MHKWLKWKNVVINPKNTLLNIGKEVMMNWNGHFVKNIFKMKNLEKMLKEYKLSIINNLKFYDSSLVVNWAILSNNM